MNSIFIFASLSFLFSAAAYVPYTKAVLTSNANPTISTWISWWIMDFAILAGMIAKNALAWQMVAYVIGCGFVVGAGIYKGRLIGWTRLDSLCVAIVVTSMLLWFVVGDANIAIILSLAAIVVGCVPMIINTAKNPEREPVFPWLLVLVGGICGVLAIDTWSIASALTPVVFLILQVLFLGLISRKWLGNQATA